MAIFLRGKNFLLSRLKSLTTLQRLPHTITEQTRPFPVMEGYFQQNSVIDMSKWTRIDADRVGIKRSMIPPFAWCVLKILHDKGFHAYLVGGCVRDLLLNRIPKDYDVITTAKLKQVKKQFHHCHIVGVRFPICRVHIKGSVVEVSSFETVAQHAEEKENLLLSQIPIGCDEKDFMCWRNSMHRDFTVNSLFFDPFMNQICDYANGMEDIRNLKLRTLIPARLSFQEDCARILRGLRIAGRLGLSISKDTELAIRKFASSVENLSKARIMMEFNYMLSYGAAESTIRLLQRFNLLELFLPFHASYLNQQFGKTSSWSSVMLMKLFVNLDKLVSSDRPCHCSLWIGLLAFHQALVTNPQDAFVIWVFASVLYHGKWKEGVKFARENAKVQVKFAPEISGFFEFKSDDELSEEVSHLAALVQDSFGSMDDTDILAQPMSLLSNVVFVSKRLGNDVVQLFDVLVNDIETYKNGRESFVIDYNLLQKGNHNEIRFVLGKVILETLSGGLAKGEMEVALEEPEVIEEYDPKLSDLVKHQAVKGKGKKRNLFDPEDKKNMPKKHRGEKMQSLSDKKHATVENEKCQNISRKHKKAVVKVKYNISHHKETIKQTNESGNSNLSNDKCQIMKDGHVSLQEMVEGKPEKFKHVLVKKNSGQTSLSNIFR